MKPRLGIRMDAWSTIRSAPGSVMLSAMVASSVASEDAEVQRNRLRSVRQL